MTTALVNKAADLLLAWRKPLAVLFFAVTLGFAWSASRIQLDPGFLKLIPVEHPYMRTMMDHMRNFSGANALLVNLRWKGEGDIYNKAFMDALQKATDDVFFIPGINRTKVSSLFTPSTYYIEITEYGFAGEPVVPNRYSGQPDELAEIRKNVRLSGQIGLLVANDLKGAMIRSDLLEYDPDLDPDAQQVDYWAVQLALEEIRGRFENPEKYVYRMKEDRAPFKAGEEVLSGYVDHGWMLGFQEFEVLKQVEGTDGAQSFTVSGDELDVEVVDNPDYNPNIEVNIIGFARLLGDVINGLLGVFAFFALAFLITALLLYLYTRSLRITVAGLGVATLPVLWLIGVLPIIGYGVDPMSILVPFLIFAIGVSHAVQMTSAWRLEVLDGKNSVDAAHASFTKLFIPGAVALLTEALGFGVIMMIDIPIVSELGITACIGVLLMIITNKMILPIILSYLSLEESSKQHSENSMFREGTLPMRIICACATPRGGLVVFACSLLVLGAATWKSRDLVIGDTGTGQPELHEDSRYNRDNQVINETYDIGTDLLTVIVEAPDYEGDSCLQYEVVSLIDEFELFLRGVAGVQSVTSVAGVGKLVISAYSEGNPAWRALPRTEQGLSAGSKAFDPNLGLNTEGCKAIQVLVFLQDHEGRTIDHVVREIKRFQDSHSVDGVELRLASGNVGVMAATNESVSAAEVNMLLALFGALVLFCLASFRSWIATVCVLTPLVLVCVMCNALMATIGIGLKVATLPVVALGVGVGVDYGLYLFERVQHYMQEEGADFYRAFIGAMQDRGAAAVFTAATMSIGVATWTLSALKFQADMGLLLAFMFLVNMFGAVCLLPALGAWFYKDHVPASRTSESVQPN